MANLANFQFIRPEWLLLLPVVIATWWFWRRRSDPLGGWRDQIDADLLAALREEQTDRHHRSAYVSLVAGCLMVIAIAGPTWKRDPSPFAADAAPLMILLKADTSMEEIGATPTLLERAQLKIADLTRIRQGQPVGLIAYAGSAHLVLPPTRDTSIVSEMASEISSDIMPQPGDRLDFAIKRANEILTGGNAGGSLLVMADTVEGDISSLSQTHHTDSDWPIQFLTLDDDPSIITAAKALNGTVVELTPTDDDVSTIARAAERKAVTGVEGDSERWQEAGYWIVPFLMVLVLGRFRREQRPHREGQR